MCMTRWPLDSALHMALHCRPAGGDCGSGGCWALSAMLAPAAWQGQGNGAAPSAPNPPHGSKPWQAAEGLDYDRHRKQSPPQREQTTPRITPSHLWDAAEMGTPWPSCTTLHVAEVCNTSTGAWTGASWKYEQMLAGGQASTSTPLLIKGEAETGRLSSLLKLWSRA